MKPFTTLAGIAAPLPMINVDTDMIVPKQYLKTVRRTGLGAGLFAELRFREDGSEKADFVLNREPWRRASILIAGDNFGCGSSREHAPWALLDFGIRCIVAPGFAEIFFENCANNGILALVLAQDQVRALQRLAAEAATRLTVDLPAQTVAVRGGPAFAFAIEPERKRRLLAGLDAVALGLEREADIAAYEARVAAARPWLLAPPPATAPGPA